MLESIYLYFPPSSQLVYLCLTEVTSTPTRDVDNVVIATKGLQDRNIHLLDGTTVNCPSQETEETTTPIRLVENVVLTTKGLQERNTTVGWDDGGKICKKINSN